MMITPIKNNSSKVKPSSSKKGLSLLTVFGILIIIFTLAIVAFAFLSGVSIQDEVVMTSKAIYMQLEPGSLKDKIVRLLPSTKSSIQSTSQNQRTSLRSQAEPSDFVINSQPINSNNSSGSTSLKHYLSLLNNIDPMNNPFNTIHNSTPFEMIECPDQPPQGYPKAYSIRKILGNWNTDDTNIPPHHYDSLCHFNYQTEYGKAVNYQKAEVPFVVYNIPEVNEVVKKWSDPDYLSEKLGKLKTYRSETSDNNHFMYWRSAPHGFKDSSGAAWKEPTSVVYVTFESWLQNAITNHNKSLEERNHIYFRVTSHRNSDENGWIFDELPFFQPRKSLFIVDPQGQRGIHCRFGMKSVIAESHFDGSRNMAASLGGLRRWILNSPDECDHMHLLPRNHPSGRHSEVDWSKPDYKKFSKFGLLQANEVIVRPGDVLYLPTDWFHYIISLNVNYQCNTRSGRTTKWSQALRKCGF